MTPFTIVAAAYMSIVSVLTVFGNGLVILSWILHKPVRSPSNAYLVSLAIVDFITGAFQMPLLIGYGLTEKWLFGKTLCFMYIFDGWVLISASIFHLLAIALDRYHVIFDGISYISRRTGKSVMLEIAVIWAFSIWQMAPIVFDYDEISSRINSTGFCRSIPTPVHRLHIGIGTFYFPGVLIAIVYYNVYKGLKERLAKRKGNLVRDLVETTSKSSNGPCSGDAATNSWRTDEDNRLARERKAAKRLGIIIGAFAISWLPFFMMHPIIGFVPEDYRPSTEVFVLVLALGFTNSCVNPLIYASCDPRFKESFKKILRLN